MLRLGGYWRPLWTREVASSLRAVQRNDEGDRASAGSGQHAEGTACCAPRRGGSHHPFGFAQGRPGALPEGEGILWIGQDGMHDQPRARTSVRMPPAKMVVMMEG